MTRRPRKSLGKWLAGDASGKATSGEKGQTAIPQPWLSLGPLRETEGKPPRHSEALCASRVFLHEAAAALDANDSFCSFGTQVMRPPPRKTTSFNMPGELRVACNVATA